MDKQTLVFFLCLLIVTVILQGMYIDLKIDNLFAHLSRTCP